MAIEHLGGIRQGDTQPAGIYQRAGVVDVSKAFSDWHRGFHGPEHAAYLNLRCRAPQFKTAIPAAVCFEISQLPQLVNHLSKVVL